jgi:acetyl-CoA carboxylase biotin carboxyl carrier protein
MDIKLVKELGKLMRDNELVELEVESGDLKVRMAKARGADAHTVIATPVPAMAAPLAAAPVAAVVAAAPAAAPAADDLAGCKTIIAPVPGTVYLRPKPDAKAYANVGDTIKDGQVVCLVEAMKVFNEIKSEGVSGTVRKIAVTDGQAVEYGTVLYYIA